ncbi:MAG: DUF262 domain-containing protein [Bacteroidia bacterium]
MATPKIITKNDINKLEETVNIRKKEFFTDSYPMSIGEISSIYREGELSLNPDFQRLFRWSIKQQSELIESILLGVPLPSIFVFQNDQGVWEVVDGMQRLSTIFAFMGILKEKDLPPHPIGEEGEETNLIVPSKLIGTDNIPELEAITWADLPTTIQLSIKRGKLDIKIIKDTSHRDAKYEVFQRLNRGGSLLSAQEFRNSLMSMINKHFFKWLTELCKYANYQTCINLSERLLMEQYDMELALRLFILDEYEYQPKNTLSEFLDSKMKEICNPSNDFNFQEAERKFKCTFDILEKIQGENVFKKERKGKFMESYFEAIAIGLYANIENYKEDSSQYLSLLEQRIAEIEKHDDFTNYRGAGVGSSKRIPNVIKFGKNYFRKNAETQD